LLRYSSSFSSLDTEQCNPCLWPGARVVSVQHISCYVNNERTLHQSGPTLSAYEECQMWLIASLLLQTLVCWHLCPQILIQISLLMKKHITCMVHPWRDRICQQLANDESFSIEIEGYEWQDGDLLFWVRWTTNGLSMAPITLMQRDYPRQTALYILDKKVRFPGSCFTNGEVLYLVGQKYTCQISGIVRCLLRRTDGVEETMDSTRS
jgi:hypothetical protein